MAKKKFNTNGIVYSTNPDLMSQKGEDEKRDILPAGEQMVRVRLDKKNRAGKIVTLISGLDTTDAEIEELGKKIKKYCGTGGSVIEDQVLIQGDFREKVLQWLKKNGYNKAKII